jgi:hypothetical protein
MTAASEVRANLSRVVRQQVLTESGYRCANPTCGVVLAMNLHHLEHVAEGGGDVVENIIALCPNCHTLHHNGHIERAALVVWKSILQLKSSPFDRDTFKLLHMVSKMPGGIIKLSGDGLLFFGQALISGYIETRERPNSLLQSPTSGSTPLCYEVSLTTKGRGALENWLAGRSPDTGAGGST